MRVCVSGLWHLGAVTAACLAAAGHDVVGQDPDQTLVEGLRAGVPPVQEPGLESLIHEGLASGRLTFASDEMEAARSSEVVWITHDTPVGNADRADPDVVVRAASAFFPHLAPGSLMLISSQVPVGTTRLLADSFRSAWPDRHVQFAYSPENLQLGTAIDAFMRPMRIVVGLENPGGRATVSSLLEPLGSQIEWMSVEAAEMTKQALNAFLAASIVFANEIATVCESVGADVSDVMLGLHGDARIGPRAYLGVGTGYAGGTLGRDVTYLSDLISARKLHAPLLTSIGPSNRYQQKWVRRTLVSLIGDLGGKQIGIWGLTYKPGTDTLRRSAALELCKWLVEHGAIPTAHDPAIERVPESFRSRVSLTDPLSAIRHADALVVMTPWPEYRSVAADVLLAEMRHPVVLDPARLLAETVGLDPRFRYATVGMGRP